MSFGRKGLAAGVMTAPSGAAAFGRAPLVQPPIAQASAADDDMAARREVFIASERLRNAQENTPEETPDQAIPEHDPLINLRNMTRPARPAAPIEPVGEAAIGPGGLAAVQEAQIRAAGRSMARSSTAGYAFGDPHSRSVGLAYVLWFVLGQASLHRFYCGQKDSAIFQVCLMIGSFVTLFIFPPMGLIGLGLWVVWLMADLFLIPGMMREFKAKHDYQSVFD